jgi:hypothetical protein
MATLRARWLCAVEDFARRRLDRAAAARRKLATALDRSDTKLRNVFRVFGVIYRPPVSLFI